MRRLRLPGVALVGLAALAVGWPSQRAPLPLEAPAFASAKLADLRIIDSRPVRPGYDRGCGKGRGCAFGPAWSDAVDVLWGRNGCDTRSDVLRFQLTDLKVADDGCHVRSGTLHDPYTGKLVDYSPGRRTLEVDHVYPLALAWDMGAAAWTEERRLEFANDPRNLLATAAAENRSKSDASPAQWKPAAAAVRCEYARRYVTVAVAYDLPVTAADVDALAQLESACI